MLRSYKYNRCCCINEPVISSHCVHSIGHRFRALLIVCSDRGNDIVFKLKGQYRHNEQGIDSANISFN